MIHAQKSDPSLGAAIHTVTGDIPHEDVVGVNSTINETICQVTAITGNSSHQTHHFVNTLNENERITLVGLLQSLDVPTIQLLAHDESTAVRMAVVQNLQKIPDAFRSNAGSFCSIIMDFLNTKEPELRNAARTIMHNLGLQLSTSAIIHSPDWQRVELRMLESAWTADARGAVHYGRA